MITVETNNWMMSPRTQAYLYPGKRLFSPPIGAKSSTPANKNPRIHFPKTRPWLKIDI